MHLNAEGVGGGYRRLSPRDVASVSVGLGLALAGGVARPFFSSRARVVLDDGRCAICDDVDFFFN